MMIYLTFGAMLRSSSQHSGFLQSTTLKKELRDHKLVAYECCMACIFFLFVLLIEILLELREKETTFFSRAFSMRRHL